MKIERKITFVQSLVNLCLFLSIGVSGAMLVLLFHNPAAVHSPQTEFRVILTNIFLLGIVLTSVNLLFRTLNSKPLKDKQYIDRLTGFMSRQDFVPVFEKVLLDSHRSGEPLSLLMIDVDHFRRINEKHGQQAGDQILTMLGKSIQSGLRTSDITCRWAGDQFLVILKDCTVKDACQIAAKILVAIRQQELVLGGKTIRVTCSIGTARMVKGDIPKTLIARAETGLHAACDNGRDTCAIGYDWILLEYYSKPIF